MKLTFLGTRGYTDERTPRHRMHSALQVSHAGRDVVIDCGEDWLGEVQGWDVDAIVITHAHPDHVGGLVEGAPCPVVATRESWAGMEAFEVKDRRVIEPRTPTEVAGITFEAFPVDHSTRAPAVGYRITAGEVTIFYVPDVVYIRDRAAALAGARIYIGDAATVTQSFVRRIDGALIGHTPLRTQLTWCQKEGVSRAIFTHCGPDLVGGDEKALLEVIEALARERGVEAQVAHDGLEVVLA
jgi:phosphoribosyl 1,2-cyclic phosphodiesterase